MTQLVSVKLSRFDSQPWGFRLQGGKDFGTPLAVQKVNGNSIAEKAGLQAGDSVIRVNNVDLYNLTHKEAQHALVQAGNSFEITVQRGGSTWKPSVTPVGPAPTAPSATIQPVTKTSLAYKGPPAQPVGSGHNTAAKPFGPSQVNGETAKTLASKLYNSPVGLYSEETIAETLSAQTEVLAGGVLGVNFKKNEKMYNAANSEVLKMVQEIDNEPREPEPAAPISAPTTPKVSNIPVTNPFAGLRHVEAPTTKPDVPQDPLKILPPGQNICADCERLIVGLFVRIKDKNLHVECFKCATCGQSLKNVGYYNINNKLYCDVHAKLAARQNPPAPNLEPVTIPPGVKPPSSIIGSALASAPPPLQPYQPSSVQSPGVPAPGSPLPGTLGPLPFHAPLSGIRHVNAPRSAPFGQAPSSVSQVSAPSIQAPKPAAVPTFQPPKPNFAPAPVAPSVPRPLSGIFSGLRSSTGFRGGAGGAKGATFAGASAPRRGRGVLNPPNALRVPLCASCNGQIRGPFITALGKIWCPDHFICSTPQCRRPLADIGFVEEQNQLYCEFCFEKYIAPNCDKCNSKIKGDCLNAIGKHFHPECFTCAYCGKLFGNSPFFLEDGLPYCENDWNELFTTKCFACGFPIEAGDRWVEALNNNYHSQCFNCTVCKKNLEGQSFFAKGGRPFCKTHAR